MQRGDDKACSGSDGDITGPLPKGCLDTLDGQPPKPPPVDERTRIVGLYATTILTPPICDFPPHNFFTLNRILATHDLCFSLKTKMGGGFKHQTIAYLPVKDESFLEIGSEKFGCTHYERRCKIVAPCCNEVFDCRHCHNDAKNSLEVDALDRHDIPRHELKRVICSMCETEQDVQQMCITCGACLGKYYCSVCKFFDDDVSKNHYHCEKCGICRTGGKENFFHCDKCGCCYSNILKDSHVCVERAMHHNCPICFEYLFDTPRDTTVLPCGHTIHLDCVKDMERHFQYSCPVCLKSYCDMTHVWEKLDQEIAATPMPQIYRNKMVWILCNDCGETSEVNFHVLANKCTNCKSYNTRQTRGGHSTCSSGIIPEMVQ